MSSAVGNRTTRQPESSEKQDTDENSDRDVLKRPYSIAGHSEVYERCGQRDEHKRKDDRAKMHGDHYDPFCHTTATGFADLDGRGDMPICRDSA